MPFTRRGVVAGALATAAAPAKVRAATADAVLWEVRQGSAKVYLFGEIGGMRTPWTSPRIEAALAESRVLWKETPEAGPDATRRLLARGVDRAAPLSTWLTPDQHARVDAAAVTVGSTAAFIEPFHPWLAAQFLESQFYPHFGFKGENGPEPRLTKLAKAAGTPIRTEFPDSQAMLDMFATLSPKAEVQLLLRAVDDVEAGPDQAERVNAAWAAGDLNLETREAQRIATTYPELFEAYALARNRLWPARVHSMLGDGGTSFIMIGSGHLAGPHNVLDELAKSGLRARRV